MPQEIAISKAEQAALLGVTWISAFLVSLDYTAISVALPTIAVEFKSGTSLISWVSLTYLLVMIPLMLVVGPVIGRVGYRPALFAGLVLYAAAALACALAETLWTLVALRAAQGVGATIMFVVGPAMIRTLLPEDVQGRAFALFATAPMTGLLAGPAIGGELVFVFGWPSIFFVNLPFVAAAIFLLSMLRNVAGDIGPANDNGSTIRFANPAIVTLAVISCCSIIVALNQGAEWGWSSKPILGLISLGLCAGTASILIECRSQNPLVNRNIMKSPDFNTATLVLGIVLVVFGGLVFLMPFYFQWLRNLNLDSIGPILAVQPLATICVSVFLGYCLQTADRRVICLTGIGALGIGVVVLALAPGDATLLLPIAAMVLIGVGVGLYYPTLMQASIARVPRHLVATASSLQTAFRLLAQMFGLVIFETIFSGVYPTALRAAKADAAQGEALVRMHEAFQVTFWVAAFVVALAFLPALLLSRDPLAPAPGRDHADSGEKS